ncbi:vWA domain-containing protein [Aeoliella mucimassa]|uniref:von Willebrand factor type A domain protein n=1 Tax=Aeoliella mucimassa TaxID=2527972 RepID=A0A518AP88_9BACT|nr:VWA domain-containing protein [Aeoliella mucimassa]QDU56537.1 von Willebrand factor type A domain protein [Aeoliella mucimassa]
MSFRLFWPIIVLLMLVPIAILLWQWRRRRPGVVMPYDHGQTGSGPWLRTLLNSVASLPALLLAVVVLILAGPTRLTEPEVHRKLTNIEFCVDVSGSMMATFGEGNRYDASMQAIDDFLVAREGDAFGLTFFGNEVMHWVPITTDSSAIRYAPPFMRPEVAPPMFGGTEIGKALLACQRRLIETDNGDRMILLVSDGNSFDLLNGSDMEIANQLKENNIVLYAIHIAESEIPDPIINITSYTGGEAFSAGDVEGLNSVFTRIDDMEQAEMERTAADAVDYYRPYALTGLSIIGLGLVCSLGLRYTPW